MSETTVDDLGAAGDGIATVAGERLFIPYAAPGDRLVVEPPRGRQAGAKARILELLAGGAVRREPPCPYFGRCGGCVLQHLDPAFVSEWKRRKVETALKRRGLDGVAVAPLVPGGPARRRRVSLTAKSDRKGRLVLGFHERGSHRLIDVRACMVLEPALQALLSPLRELLATHPPKRGEARVQANVTDTGVDMLVEAAFAPSPERFEALAEFAATHDLARLTLLAEGVEMPVAERRAPRLAWPTLAVAPPPGAFLQADREVERELRRRVAEAAVGATRAIDLFAGIGTLGSALAENRSVHFVDADPRAIVALERATNAWPGGGLSVEQRNLFRRPVAADELHSYDIAVLDPPAAGAREQASALARSTVPRVVYVSCEPATFARDARLLVDGGYRLSGVTPLDQFFWAADVELVAVFER